MKDIFKFNKESDGKWYVDLPTWEGSHADLEMVSGADLMLDMLSGYTDTISLNVSTESFKLRGQIFILSLIGLADDIGSGAYYHFNNQLIIYDTNVDIEIWLCDVMLKIFNHFPQKIYFQIIN
jgi:hypothetical protein